MEQALPQLAVDDQTLRILVERSHSSTPDAQQAYLRVFQELTRPWVRGELDAPEHEPWATFKERVRIGITQIVSSAGSGKTVVAFTSGGVIATAVGLALQLHDEQIIELSWAIRNASCTEFVFSGRRFSLRVFNASSPAGPPELISYV